MRFWGYFVAKLAAAGGALYLAFRGLEAVMPEPEIFLYHRLPRFPYDLPWTSALLVFWLVSIGVVYLAVWDQRRRCRRCARKLRMPVETGNWGEATLFSQPKTESICPYGHGTLETPEVHVGGARPAEWHPHGDMWRELEEIESGRK